MRQCARETRGMKFIACSFACLFDSICDEEWRDGILSDWCVNQGENMAYRASAVLRRRAIEWQHAVRMKDSTLAFRLYYAGADLLRPIIKRLYAISYQMTHYIDIFAARREWRAGNACRNKLMLALNNHKHTRYVFTTESKYAFNHQRYFGLRILSAHSE